MTEKSKPFALPSGWPVDRRSKMTHWNTGWILVHPERQPMYYKDGKWQEIKLVEQQQQGVA